jgi:hypothetical protein
MARDNAVVPNATGRKSRLPAGPPPTREHRTADSVAGVGDLASEHSETTWSWTTERLLMGPTEIRRRVETCGFPPMAYELLCEEYPCVLIYQIEQGHLSLDTCAPGLTSSSSGATAPVDSGDSGDSFVSGYGYIALSTGGHEDVVTALRVSQRVQVRVASLVAGAAWGNGRVGP